MTIWKPHFYIKLIACLLYVNIGVDCCHCCCQLCLNPMRQRTPVPPNNKSVRPTISLTHTHNMPVHARAIIFRILRVLLNERAIGLGHRLRNIAQHNRTEKLVRKVLRPRLERALAVTAKACVKRAMHLLKPVSSSIPRICRIAARRRACRL